MKAFPKEKKRKKKEKNPRPITQRGWNRRDTLIFEAVPHRSSANAAKQ